MNYFEVAAGSVTGRDHVRPLSWKNNQDAYAVSVDTSSVIAVVCDGCSSSPHSEVGAKLAARIILKAIRSIPFDYSPEEFWPMVKLDVLYQIREFVESMASDERQAKRILIEYFLFSFVGVLITGQRTTVFGCGDGAAWLNGSQLPRQSYPGNAPPYLAYNLLSQESGISPEIMREEIRVLAEIPAREVTNLLIASDGIEHFAKAEKLGVPGKEEDVGPVSQFWTEDRFFKNPDNIRRRLALVNNENTSINWDARRVEKSPGRLPDDTTIVVIRRKPEAQDG